MRSELKFWRQNVKFKLGNVEEVFSDEEMLFLVLLLRRSRRQREGEIEEKPKSVWVREIFRRRKERGDYHNLNQ